MRLVVGVKRHGRGRALGPAPEGGSRLRLGVRWENTQQVANSMIEAGFELVPRPLHAGCEGERLLVHEIGGNRLQAGEMDVRLL